MTVVKGKCRTNLVCHLVDQRVQAILALREFGECQDIRRDDGLRGLCRNGFDNEIDIQPVLFVDAEVDVKAHADAFGVGLLFTAE